MSTLVSIISVAFQLLPNGGLIENLLKQQKYMVKKTEILLKFCILNSAIAYKAILVKFWNLPEE